MSLIGRWLGLAPRAVDINDERIWSPTTVGASSAAGIAVSPQLAMRASAVWGCVRIIAESMASLPLLLYKASPDGSRHRALGNPLYDILHRQPNAHQTAFEFIEQMTAIVLLYGDAVAEIRAGPRWPVDELLPINPERLQIEQVRSGALRYRILGMGQPDRVLLDDQVLHVRGLSFGGLTGLSVIEYARESIGLALATERYGARFFGNDSRPGGILKHPAKLSPEAAKRLKESWEAAHTGGNQHRVAVFEEGMEWQQVGIAPEDAQFLQTREFQVTDIARWFRVPLHMIQETSKSTSWGSGIEQLSLAFVQFTLLPWARRWEQAISRDLILAPQTYFAEFKLDALARGDLQSRYTAYSIGRNWGWLSANDIRQLENMNPVEGGDAYLVPLNMRDATDDAVDLVDAVGAVDDPQEAEPGDGADGVDESDGADQADGADGSGRAQYEGYLRWLVTEAGQRIVRKEYLALERARRRAAGDQRIWAAAVAEFYEDHALMVSQTLGIPLPTAQRYVAERRTLMEEYGMVGLDDQLDVVDMLIKMAMEGQRERV